MSALASTTQDVTPFDTSRLSNIFSGVPNAAELNTTTNIGDTFTMPEQSFVNSLFTDQNYNLSPEAKQQPGFFSGLDIQPAGLEREGNRGPM